MSGVQQLMWRTYSSGGVNVHTTEVCPDHAWIYTDAAEVLGVIVRFEPVKLPCGVCGSENSAPVNNPPPSLAVVDASTPSDPSQETP